jgi:IMP cyclohydrolase
MEQLATSKTNKPNQNAARLRVMLHPGLSEAFPPRNQTAKATNQARVPAAKHHQAENPNIKYATSAIQAPVLPTQLRTCPSTPELDQEGSCRL